MKIKHLHIYKALKNGIQYKCTKEGCPSIIHINMMEGRKAECPYCHNGYIITKETLRRKILHCGTCSRHGKLLKEDKPLEITQDESSIFDALINQSSEFKGGSDS